MFEPFQLPFVQHGIVEVLILAVAGGLIGTWIVLRGLAFYAHAVGTAAFPGLVLAEGLGFAAVLGAGASAALVALTVGLLARREGARDRYDSLTALVLAEIIAEDRGGAEWFDAGMDATALTAYLTAEGLA